MTPFFHFNKLNNLNFDDGSKISLFLNLLLMRDSRHAQVGIHTAFHEESESEVKNGQFYHPEGKHM